MKRPAFQFYPGDWLGNLKLRTCSEAARGAWIDILCVLHASQEYGVFRQKFNDLLRAAGVSKKAGKELVLRGVLKGGDCNVPAYIFSPTHAGRKGPPVTLLQQSQGPMWYCSRFVRDEYIRGRRGESSRFTPSPKPPRDYAPTGSPKPRLGDGPSSSSSITTNTTGETGNRPAAHSVDKAREVLEESRQAAQRAVPMPDQIREQLAKALKPPEPQTVENPDT